jgi:long-chain acyl-CoA synthetase
MSLFEWLANRLMDVLVRRKAAARFGGRLKAMIAGGAPLNPDIGLFFTALGLRLLPGYGQTEAGPVVSCNPPFGTKLDAVGPPFKEVEVRIAEDGEILVRGPLVMSGYWGDPTSTRAALRDGWLHTGDVGRIDEDGHLHITDRKRDIIVLSGGDNVSPQRVEGILMLQHEIGQAMAFGDRRPYVSALIVPDEGFLQSWAEANGRAADLAALADDPRLREAIATAVERANHDLSSIERIKRFAIAREPFSIENGQMTPTLKVRRHEVLKVCRERLEALYEG